MSQSTQPSTVKIYGLLALVVLAWSGSWPMTKLGLVCIPPFWFVFLRVAFAAVIMFAIVIALKKFRWPSLKDLPMIIIIGALQIAFFLTFINLGLLQASAGRGAILTYTTPLWVTPIAILLFGERITPLKLIGLLLGLIGILILFDPSSFNWHDRQRLLANGAFILSAMAWAIGILCSRYGKWHKTPLELAPWQYLLAALVILPVTLWIEPQAPTDFSFSCFIALFYNVVFSTVFAFWGAVQVSKLLPAVTTSLSFLAVPVISMVLSSLLLGETITQTMLVSVLVISSGLVLIVLSENKQGRKQ